MRKATKHILIAFIILTIFGILELLIGNIVNSVTLISNSFKTLFISTLIGVSYVLEKISEKKKNYKYTFGYRRYSLLGAVIISIIFLQTQLLVIYLSIERLMDPIEINEGIIINFSIINILINSVIYYFTRKAININEESVNLHIKENLYAWIGVLIGSLVIRYTGLYIIDPLISIIINIYIIYNIIKHLGYITDIFLQKVPEDLDLKELRKKLIRIKKVEDISNMQIWKIDEEKINFTAKALIDYNTSKKETEKLLKEIKRKLKKYGIEYSTIEFNYQDNDKI